MTSELQRLCDRKGVKIESRYGGVEIPEGFARDSHPYKVTLTYQRRRMTVPFFMGSALDHEPTAADVLSCLCSDAMGVENAGSFEDWCAEYGFATDSRKAEATFKACERNAAKVRQLLGEDFDTFARVEH
jgi:hypothetical protein